MPAILPPYLKPGDRVAIVCPAGYMASEKTAACIDALKQEGYEVVVGETVGGLSQNYFSADDSTRAAEMQTFLDDKSISAILCARGGYGCSRIVDDLNFKKFERNPKWLIGFSDVTVFHSHLLQNYNIAGLHAPMAAAFNDGPNEFNRSLLDALKGVTANYAAAPHPFNRSGKAKGTLIGGNLALLAHCIGSTSDVDTAGCILFIEDIGECFYNIDRLLLQLKRAGKLKKLKGLVVGGFTDMRDTDRPFGKTIDEIIRDAVAEYDYPVCFNFPVSHGKENVALKIGVKHKLIVDDSGSTLIEA